MPWTKRVRAQLVCCYDQHSRNFGFFHFDLFASSVVLRNFQSNSLVVRITTSSICCQEISRSILEAQAELLGISRPLWSLVSVSAGVEHQETAHGIITCSSSVVYQVSGRITSSFTHRAAISIPVINPIQDKSHFLLILNSNLLSSQ